MIYFSVRLVPDNHHGCLFVEFVVTPQEEVRLDEAQRLSSLVQVAFNHFVVTVYSLKTKGISVLLFLFIQVSCWLASTAFAFLVLIYGLAN